MQKRPTPRLPLRRVSNRACFAPSSASQRAAIGPPTCYQIATYVGLSHSSQGVGRIDYLQPIVDNLSVAKPSDLIQGDVGRSHPEDHCARTDAWLGNRETNPAGFAGCVAGSAGISVSGTAST